MPIKPKDSRLLGFGRVKPRLQRLPKRQAIPEGITLAHDPDTGARISYNPPASSPNPLVTPTAFLPPHLRQYTQPIAASTTKLPKPLAKPREKTLLNPEQIEEIKDLRRAGNSVKEVAKKFSVSTLFVSLVSPLAKTERTKLRIEEEARKSTWSERKQVFAQIRQNKRASWGLA